MFKIVSWSSHQSYKDRRPPWIRFHKTLLDNFDFQSMSVNTRAILPMLWLLASEHEDPTSGIVDQSFKAIAFRLRLSEKEISSAVHEAEKAGFITLENTSQTIENKTCNETVTKPYLNRNETVHPETETEAETKTETSDFDLFWNEYPLKKGKANALKAFLKTNTPLEEILKGLRGYKAELKKKNTAPEYIKHAATWLNGKHWEDQYSVSYTPNRTPVDRNNPYAHLTGEANA